MRNYFVSWTEDLNILYDIGQRNRSIDYEKHLEEWIENYPRRILGDEIIIVARQYQLINNQKVDLMGIDSEGNIIIIEVKRGPAPAGTLSQTLAYADLIKDLMPEEIQSIYTTYSKSKQLQFTNLCDEFSNRFGSSIDDVSINQNQILVIVSFEFTERDIRAAKYLTAQGQTVKLIELVIVPLENKKIIISSQLVRYEETDKSVYSETTHLQRIKISEVKKIYKKLIEILSNYKLGIKHTQLYSSGKYNSYTIVRIKIKPTVIGYITIFCNYSSKKDIKKIQKLSKKDKRIHIEYENKSTIKTIKISSIKTFSQLNKYIKVIEDALKNRIILENKKLE